MTKAERRAEARRRREEARLKAEQAKSAAAAEQAKAEAEATRAAAELERAKGEARRRADENAERQRAFEREMKDRADREAREAREGMRKAGINAAALGVGIAGGLAYAKKIDNQRAAAVKAAAPRLAELAKEARSAIKQYEAGKSVPSAAKKLRGIVNAADKAKLTARAPLGVAPAAVLLAEGALSRLVIAPQFEDATTREAFQAIGTTSAVAATTIVGKGSVNVAAPKVPVNARDLAAVETARTIADAETKAVQSRATKPRASKPSNISKLRPALKVAGGAGAIAIAGPAIVGMTAFDAQRNAAMAQGADATTANVRGAAAGAGAAAAVAAAGIALGRAVSQLASTAAAAAPKVARVAKFGVPGLLIGATAYEAAKGYSEGGIKGALTGAADSLTFGAASMIADAVGGLSDTTRDVAAAGAVAAVGAAAMKTGTKIALVPPVLGPMLSGHPGRAVGMALHLGGAAAMVVGAGIAGRAFLNTRAEKKAEAAPASMPASSRPSPAQGVKSDGQTAGYTRRTATGTVVHVKGYRTPDRRS